MSSGTTSSSSKGRQRGAPWRCHRLRPRIVLLLCAVLTAVPLPLGQSMADPVSLPDEVLLPVSLPAGAMVGDDPVYTIMTEPDLPPAPSEALVTDLGDETGPVASATAAMAIAIEEAVGAKIATEPPEGWIAPALTPATSSTALSQLSYPRLMVVDVQEPRLAPEPAAKVPAPTEVSAAPAAVQAPLPVPATTAAAPAAGSDGAPVAATTVAVTGTPAKQTTEPEAAKKSKQAGQGKAATRSALGAKKKAVVPPPQIIFDNARAHN